MSFLQSRAAQQRSEGGRERRTDGGSPGWRPNISTTQILVGLFLVFALLALAAMLLSEPQVPQRTEVEIVSPVNGDRFEPGLIPVRIRVTGPHGAPPWTLSYLAPGSTEWAELASGNYDVLPGYPGRGTYVIEAREPGDYQVRLVANSSENLSDSVSFRVGP